MPNRQISFSTADYPQLSTLITGQDVELIIRARVGMKLSGGLDDVISFVTESIEVLPERKVSTQEVLMSNFYSKPTP